LLFLGGGEGGKSQGEKTQKVTRAMRGKIGRKKEKLVGGKERYLNANRS